MNIWQLKEYIKDLPDDMEMRTQVDRTMYNTNLWVEDNKLIIT